MLTEDASLNALTLESVLHTRDPFVLLNDNYFGKDKQTRLVLFLVDLHLYSAETLSIINVQANDAQQRIYVLPVEDLRKVSSVVSLNFLYSGRVFGGPFSFGSNAYLRKEISETLH